MKKIILASQSPRRIELLKLLVENFEVLPANIDENSTGFSDPRKYTLEMARRKALAIQEKHKHARIIASDTIVALDGKILGKPSSRKEAFEMLKSMSGRTHSVMTSIVILDFPQVVEKVVETSVEFFDLTDKEIENYLETGEADDKAGAYGIQGRASIFVKEIHGDYLAIVGFPIGVIKQMIHSLHEEAENE
ncbi:septum formation protein [Pilibacter termitis]|uniref:dTTP/UTP pyrophosphatase n=1 Tax=Pilibacter termitis TaxID=263852 RepID=A0A1T4QUT1_9ENTE|nr:Maf family protein [Pilibacter termitis]SKA07530.1 septum formation protein [Pilibacter termitis]